MTTRKIYRPDAMRASTDCAFISASLLAVCVQGWAIDSGPLFALGLLGAFLFAYVSIKLYYLATETCGDLSGGEVER